MNLRREAIEAKVMAHARSEGNPCIRCGSVGSTCGRHYNGIRQHQFGKGRGKKCHWLMVADFCSACDAEFQEGSVSKNDLAARIEYSEDFMFWCVQSAIRRIEEGKL